MARVIHRHRPKPAEHMCATYVPDSSSSVQQQSHPSSGYPSALTAHIARRGMRLLLEEDGFKMKKVLDAIDHDIGRLEDDDSKKFVERTGELIKKVIKNSPTELPSVAQLTEEQWMIHAGNVHSEYMQLSQQLFHDGINWGRLVAFIGFTSTYCLYAMQQGIQETIVESVAAWMVQVLTQDHADWFEQHSWDQFVKYAEKLLQDKPRPPMLPHPNRTERGGRWQGLATVGAVGLGAVIAFAIGNALS